MDNLIPRREPKFSFRVTGRGEFPFEMLAIGRCWPRDPTTASEMGRKSRRTIWMESDHPPADFRWASMQWTVSHVMERGELGAVTTSGRWTADEKENK